MGYSANELEKYIGFRTFVIYRGGSSGNQAGIEIARHLAKEVLAGNEKYEPVFFAEDLHYDFKQYLDPIFESIEKVIVVLNVNFFDGFFVDLTGEPIPESESITRLELEKAFDHGCELFPVFTGEFDWRKVGDDMLMKLDRYYGPERFSRLRHMSNTYRWNQIDNSRENILSYFEKTSLDGLRKFLNHLKSETERDFENKITQFANRNNLVSTQENLRELINEPDYPDSYAAFYMLQIMLRQKKDFDEMRSLFEQYREEFSSHSSYNHLWSVYLIESGQEFDYDNQLRLTFEDGLKHPENAGYLHSFSDMFATVCENIPPQERKAFEAKWGKKAEEMVDKAIGLDKNYAKYYCTKGRILALKKDYRGAQHYINLAIDKEDSKRQDYVIRLLSYQNHLTMIRTEKWIDQLKEGDKV